MTNIDLAVAYYTAMHNKNIEALAQYLHPDVQFIGPFAQIHGKDAVLAAAMGFMNVFMNLTIRSKFADGDQVVLIYDLECEPPVGTFRVAALFTFDDGLIRKLELLFDARVFRQK